ncbi:MAG: DNA recombination protein RmuC [Christensenellales bacterium]|jgi:DNA recombination protein RmuC
MGDWLPWILAGLLLAATVAALIFAFRKGGGRDDSRLLQELEKSRSAADDRSRKDREEISLVIARSGEQNMNMLTAVIGLQEQKLEAMRRTLEESMQKLRGENEQKLEMMRATVDERLNKTLSQRVGESFATVSQRLEQVHRGLGEMQELASGVGDLKRILSNVKTRGVWGEVQLGNILEQIMAPHQYECNVQIRPGSGERVEYAVCLPGADENSKVYLPIDAKFPMDEYQRLLDAQDAADADAAARAGSSLETSIKRQAQNIAKYIAPPYTTDFAIMFLPTEGLYAEVLRRPGLCEHLQSRQRIILSGPTTLTGLLNSLQVGFKTLAIEQRTSEVWALLAAVKTEFAKFENVVEKAQSHLNMAVNDMNRIGTRTRAIRRQLKNVELLAQDGQEQALFADEEDETTDFIDE